MTGISKRPPAPVPAWLKKLEEASGGRSLKQEIKRKGEPPIVILAVDCSESMKGDKIRQARRGAMEFGEDAVRRGYLVGVIKFSSAAATAVVSRPSIALERFRVSLERLTASGGTAMANGIDLAVSEIGGRPGGVICIVTDGEPNSQEDTIASARAARAKGIEIMAVGTDDADWKFLSQIVSRTELAAKVDRVQFRAQIAGMAKKLPQIPASGKKRLLLPGK